MSLFAPLSLFGMFAGPFPVPARTASAAERGRGQGRPPGRRGARLVLDAGKSGRRLGSAAATVKTSRARRASISALAALGLVAWAAGATAQPQRWARSSEILPGAEIAQAVSEASQRFGLPKAWIYAVMLQESGGQPDAVSPKGAMGLLQLMPATWRELTLQLGLGQDPYDVRANVLAGSAYLRRMYERFGSPGFLAAYNAGPERYARYLSGAQPLPLETQLYLQRLAPLIDKTGSPMGLAAPPNPEASGLFVIPGLSLAVASGEPGSPVSAQGLWP